MRAIRFLILLVLWVTLALIAVDALCSGWYGMPLHPVRQLINDKLINVNILNDDRVWRGLWGAVVALLLLYWILGIALFNRRPKAIRTRTSDGDFMLIHPGALLKFVRLQVESHPAVVSHRVRIRQRGSRGLAIWVWMNVQPIDSLPNIKRQIERNIREGFAQVMGIEKLDEVTIVIGLDEKSLNRRPGPLTAPEPQPEPPVRGPVEEAAARYMAPTPTPEPEIRIEPSAAPTMPATEAVESEPEVAEPAPAEQLTHAQYNGAEEPAAPTGERNEERA